MQPLRWLLLWMSCFQGLWGFACWCCWISRHFFSTVEQKVKLWSSPSMKHFLASCSSFGDISPPWWAASVPWYRQAASQTWPIWQCRTWFLIWEIEFLYRLSILSSSYLWHKLLFTLTFAFLSSCRQPLLCRWSSLPMTLANYGAAAHFASAAF